MAGENNNQEDGENTFSLEQALAVAEETTAKLKDLLTIMEWLKTQRLITAAAFKKMKAKYDTAAQTVKELREALRKSMH
jgi:outer membrane protein TolC